VALRSPSSGSSPLEYFPGACSMERFPWKGFFGTSTSGLAPRDASQGDSSLEDPLRAAFL
jgi:hypothetical protein